MYTFFFISAELKVNVLNDTVRFGFLDEMESISESDALKVVKLILEGRAKKAYGISKGTFKVNFCKKKIYDENGNECEG